MKMPALPGESATDIINRAIDTARAIDAEVELTHAGVTCYAYGDSTPDELLAQYRHEVAADMRRAEDAACDGYPMPGNLCEAAEAHYEACCEADTDRRADEREYARDVAGSMFARNRSR